MHTTDERTLRRRVAALQIAMVVTLLTTVVGHETSDLSLTVTTQLPLLIVGAVLALLVEGLTRPSSR